MADRHTFPQAGDDDYATNFAQLISHDHNSGYVESGMSVSVDYTTPEASITSGVAFVKRNTETITDLSEERIGSTRVVQIPSDTVSLVDSDTNYIYLTPDFSTDDNGSITVYQDQSNASTVELLIETVDTSTNTATSFNREPSGSFENLDVTGEIDLEDGVDLRFGEGSSYDIYRDSTDSALKFDDTGNTTFLEFDTDGNGTFSENVTVTGSVFDLDDTTPLVSPQYIEFGRNEALFNSSPNSDANTIHISGSGGSAYPYTDFENLVIQGRSGKGDVVITNGDGSSGLDPYFSVNYGGTVQTRSGADLIVDGGLTVDGSAGIDLDSTANPAISGAVRVEYERDDWSGDHMRIEAQGSGFTGGWLAFERSSDNNEAMRISTDTLDVQIRSGDLVDGSGNVIYDQSTNKIPTERVEGGGNAETLDGLDSTDFNFREGTLYANDGTSMVGTTTGSGTAVLSSQQETLRFDTLGTGSGNIEVYNGNAAAYFIRFDETGNVVELNTDLQDGSGNVIYDQSNNYIPKEQIEDGGDAETLDGLDSTDFNVRNDTADVNGTDIFDLFNQGSGVVGLRGATDDFQIRTNGTSAADITLYDTNASSVIASFSDLDISFNTTTNFNGNESSNFVVENRTSDPSNPSVGQVWLRTDI